MKNFDLFNLFAEKVIGKPLNSVKPQYLSGWDVVEALWPLWDRFKPSIMRIRTLSYNANFEAEADTAIANLSEDVNASWANVSADTWRVLLERQEQAILMASINEASGNMNFMPIPPGFSANQRTVAAALFLLHGMKLPYPIKDRAGFEIPAGGARESLQLH